MQKKFILIVLFSLFVLSFQYTYSQSSTPDSANYQLALKAAKDLYLVSIKENYSIYNGGEYGRKGNLVHGFPFFDSAGMLKGAVYYNERWYEDLRMQFDISSEQIVIYDYSKNNLIALQNERIPEFKIDGHAFFRMDSSASLNYKGYYEQLCKGSVTLWVKRFKKMELSTGGDENGTKFKEFNFYYIQKNKLFYPINSKGSLEHLLENKDTEIKKYIRQNKIDFKHHFEDAMLRVVCYYNQLIN
jgi:hypothetical protein